MAYSNVTYTGNGTTRTFAVPFPYISQNDVTVTVGGSVVTATWPTAGTLTLAVAPSSGAVIIIQRRTPIANPSVVFSDGGTLTATDLNTAALQDLYATQEANDLYSGGANLFWSQTLTVTATNTLSALAKTPNGSFFVLTVNGQTFMPADGSFTISGNTLTWNAAAAGVTLKPGWLVVSSYTYSG